MGGDLTKKKWEQHLLLPLSNFKTKKPGLFF